MLNTKDLSSKDVFVSGHIDRVKLKGFMLGEEKLTEQEEAHLIRCKECMDNMADATIMHLKSETSADKSSGSK